MIDDKITYDKILSTWGIFCEGALISKEIDFLHLESEDRRILLGLSILIFGTGNIEMQILIEDLRILVVFFGSIVGKRKTLS